MTEFRAYPFGEDGPSLTMMQCMAMTLLILDELGPSQLDSWHMCENGCCIVIHQKGFDETAWVIDSDGETNKVDIYGNVIETKEFEHDGD